MNSRNNLLMAAGVLACLAGGAASADYIDLTSGGIGSFSDGTTVYLDAGARVGSVGSGVIDSFVRISTNNTTEQGYNTSGRPVPFDENTSATFTHDIQLSDLVTYTDPSGLASGDYYRFMLDINQQAANSLLSLDALKIYTAATGGINSNTFAGLDLRYDLASATTCAASGGASCTSDTGNGALLDYNLNSGSGNGFDMFFWVPTSVFAGLSSDTYVYLYSMFGAYGASYVNNDGYEEWAREIGATTTPPPPTVPEPTTLLLLGTGLLAIGGARRWRKAS